MSRPRRAGAPGLARGAVAAAMLAIALLGPAPARAGQGCAEVGVPPARVLAAAQTAQRVGDALDARDAPVALVSRAGTDLSAWGLHYSHVGIAVRDHPAGRWTIVHLLNACGTDASDLHAEGLVDFFADADVSQDARISWLAPADAARVADAVTGPTARAVHEPRYSMISRPDSPSRQNSTAWVLELLAAARLPEGLPADRRLAQAAALASGFAPDTVHIPYRRRVAGGLFAANVDFGDHPVRTRLDGDYPVVTVRSILRWLAAEGRLDAEWEWRGGALARKPGPA